MATGKVIDYSFMEVSNIEDLVELDPVNAEQLAKRDINGHVRPTVAMRLSYNKLSSLSTSFIPNLDRLSHGHARALRWLDLSFNQLTSLEPLRALPELAVLYVHANKISSKQEVRHLTKLTKLKKLTLHANPIAETKGYRRMVLSVLHQLPLHMFDFSVVTAREHHHANMLVPQKNAREEERGKVSAA